ncbi:MAG: hypothetical protein PHU06_05185 [Gallionella sp.]|nr:hypothetical protein [Gallionella sp.]MDD4958012.1 hypothetical protein [Gallionella sp.]
MNTAYFSWPDAARWRAFLKFMALFYVFFFPLYFGAGYVAAHAPQTFGFYGAWERNIPLVPWMIWPYLSLYSVFLLPLFHLSAKQIDILARQSTATLLIAGGILLLLPAHLGFAPAKVVGLHQPLFDLLTQVDTPHNLVPSLHVAFAALILLGCAERGPKFWAWGYGAWLVLMSASTVLVHQHHLLDVISGLGLAFIMRRIFPLGSS